MLAQQVEDREDDEMDEEVDDEFEDEDEDDADSNSKDSLFGHLPLTDKLVLADMEARYTIVGAGHPKVDFRNGHLLVSDPAFTSRQIVLDFCGDYSAPAKPIVDEETGAVQFDAVDGHFCERRTVAHFRNCETSRCRANYNRTLVALEGQGGSDGVAPSVSRTTAMVRATHLFPAQVASTVVSARQSHDLASRREELVADALQRQKERQSPATRSLSPPAAMSSFATAAANSSNSNVNNSMNRPASFSSTNMAHRTAAATDPANSSVRDKGASEMATAGGCAAAPSVTTDEHHHHGNKNHRGQQRHNNQQGGGRGGGGGKYNRDGDDDDGGGGGNSRSSSSSSSSAAQAVDRGISLLGAVGVASLRDSIHELTGHALTNHAAASAADSTAVCGNGVGGFPAAGFGGVSSADEIRYVASYSRWDLWMSMSSTWGNSLRCFFVLAFLVLFGLKIDDTAPSIPMGVVFIPYFALILLSIPFYRAPDPRSMLSRVTPFGVFIFFPALFIARHDRMPWIENVSWTLLSLPLTLGCLIFLHGGALWLHQLHNLRLFSRRFNTLHRIKQTLPASSSNIIVTLFGLALSAYFDSPRTAEQRANNPFAFDASSAWINIHGIFGPIYILVAVLVIDLVRNRTDIFPTLQQGVCAPALTLLLMFLFVSAFIVLPIVGFCVKFDNWYAHKNCWISQIGSTGASVTVCQVEKPAPGTVPTPAPGAAAPPSSPGATAATTVMSAATTPPSFSITPQGRWERPQITSSTAMREVPIVVLALPVLFALAVLFVIALANLASFVRSLFDIVTVKRSLPLGTRLTVPLVNYQRNGGGGNSSATYRIRWWEEGRQQQHRPLLAGQLLVGAAAAAARGSGRLADGNTRPFSAGIATNPALGLFGRVDDDDQPSAPPLRHHHHHHHPTPGQQVQAQQQH